MGHDIVVIYLSNPDKPESGAVLGRGDSRGELTYDWILGETIEVVDEGFSKRERGGWHKDQRRQNLK